MKEFPAENDSQLLMFYAITTQVKVKDSKLYFFFKFGGLL